MVLSIDMIRDKPFEIGETYHVYNRGAHKDLIFRSKSDYERLVLILFLANSTDPVNIRALLKKNQGRTFAEIIALESRSKPLVSILAWAFMPNHFHLVLRQEDEMGITRFMRKAMTAYTMYFNEKNEHSGVLLQGRFKSRHVGTEPYFRYIFSYLHLNPVSLVEPLWEEKGIGDPNTVREFLAAYPYSSFYDYSVGERPWRQLIAYEQAPDFMKEQNDLEELLRFYKTE
ncbi:MAG: putative transposase [Parcubacteria group bacterium Greene0714_7]|nr:MAG: putative transposase [Parcubacteria group bacterium Greene0714_7]